MLQKSNTFANNFDDLRMISGLNYNINDGIRLALGGGQWYLFYDRSKDFREKHHFHETRTINGILYCRVIGRLLFIRNVPMKNRMLWDSPRFKVDRADNGDLKRITILHA